MGTRRFGRASPASGLPPPGGGPKTPDGAEAPPATAAPPAPRSGDADGTEAEPGPETGEAVEDRPPATPARDALAGEGEDAVEDGDEGDVEGVAPQLMRDAPAEAAPPP
ncbi:hypothetical protein [Streptomyces scabiei]|uniref:hypothetical protein n=1 Tax=Streptomyces scabiei TaxID=1930 RepID=UPI000A92F552|nr:hypothetical protein [Streptomyces scabiei]